MPISRILPALVAALLPVVAEPAAARDCRLALVLALDVSGSVDADELQLMRGGLAKAMLAPEVVRAFLSGEPVALHAFEWAGQHWQRPIMPGWQMVENEVDLARMAEAVTKVPGSLAPPLPYTPTAMGSALAHAGHALSHSPGCQAQTIDISGDGWNNDGVDPDTAYAMPEFQDVTVNALVIDAGPEDRDQLLEWFQSEVLRGPRAFSILADGYEDFERAMTEKLQRELELPLVSGRPSSPEAG
jgi:hypothetical protein